MTRSGDEHEALREGVERDAGRLERAERERRSLLAQTVYLGTLGLLVALPIVGGAYLGRWLDSLAAGYSVRWTVSLIVLGVVVGSVNVWLFLRD